MRKVHGDRVGTTAATARSAPTRRLGRYEVIKHLAQSGMADVLLARTTGIEGFERHVVIKRIRAEQARDERYVQMFLDEARLAASLHHHNVVQVNDIGEEGGEYFFAMEYVHGEDARALLTRVSEQDAQVPLEHVLTIVTAAAAGLHHAHEQRAPHRTPLGIGTAPGTAPVPGTRTAPAAGGSATVRRKRPARRVPVAPPVGPRWDPDTLFPR